MIRFRLPMLAALAILAAPPPALAGTIVIYPVDPVLAAGERATALWIENRGRDPMAVQIRAFGWSQSAGEDQYVRQDEVIPSPPIATVPPGQRQLVRVIRRAPGTATAERSYRLVVDELPQPGEAPPQGAASAQLKVRMRYSIPLFAYDGDGAAGQPRLQARMLIVDGQRYVEFHNGGGRHARLVDLRLVQGVHASTAASGLLGYVLPGATMRWPLPAGAPVDASILVNVNGVDTSLAPTA